MGSRCYNCGKSFEQLGTHWRMSSKCDYPHMTQHQKEVAIGHLMSDGYLDTRSNPIIKTIMTNKEYLEHMDNVFQPASRGVVKHYTAKEMAEQQRSNGQNINAEKENYNDTWRWATRHFKELGNFTSWYESGDKIWPEDIELTPTVLKHLYVGDGTLTKNGQIRISMLNEIENTDKVSSMFYTSGLPEPIRYDKHATNCNAVFSKDQSIKLLNYMGEPIPGFEYKWDI